MKRIHLALGVLVMVLGACSSEQNTYENTIADFMQTDKRGTKYDMKFKVLEFKEIKRMTVADSIQFLKEQKDENIKKYAKLLKEAKDNVKIFEGNKDWLSVSYFNGLVKNYQKELKKWEEQNPVSAGNYQNLPKDKLRSIIVYCKYSLVPPTMNTTIEEARYFVLSPDGKTCYKKMKELK